MPVNRYSRIPVALGAKLLPVLETTKLIIRPFQKTDVETIFRLSQEKSLGKWIPDQVYKDEVEAGKVIDFLMAQYEKPLDPSQNPLVFAIVLNGSQELIGHVGLSPMQGEVEVGYAIAERYCGQGFATQAVATMAKFAVSQLSLPRVLGIVACENIGSVRVLEKAGFELEVESEMPYLGQLRLCRKYFFSDTR